MQTELSPKKTTKKSLLSKTAQKSVSTHMDLFEGSQALGADEMIEKDQLTSFADPTLELYGQNSKVQIYGLVAALLLFAGIVGIVYLL